MAAVPQTVASTDAALQWLQSLDVRALTVDSRRVAGMVDQGPVAFVAWPGAATDGRAHVPQAFDAGAAAALVDAQGLGQWQQAAAAWRGPALAVQGLRQLLPALVDRFYGQPSRSLNVVAVTGTNGKTSTSWWTAQAFNACGHPAGVIGTLGVGRPSQNDPSASVWAATGLTTPDPVTLQHTFRHFVAQGLKVAAIEASSIGIEERRLDATHIKVAQFTNFTQDHLDYHGSMQAYSRAKQKLFEWPGLRSAVINLDDPMGDELLALCQTRQVDVWTYALSRQARLQATRVEPLPQGMAVEVCEFDAAGHAIGQVAFKLPLIGMFNVSNVLCVVGALRAQGIALAEAGQACGQLTAVPGRMQPVALAQADGPPLPLVVVDYAHTPDALQKALQALRPVSQARGGALWCVFGCGGDRDASKRPMMGAVAEQYADEVVLTSDNPRSESPRLILSQILAGMVRAKPVAVIESRQEAIAHAVQQAAAGDVILVAGKGHELTQEIQGVKTPFSDVDVSGIALGQRRAV